MRMRRVGIPLGGTCEHRRAIPLPMADLGQRKGRYNLRSAGGQKDHELEVIKQQPQRSQQKPNLEAVEGCESDDLNEEEWEKIETEDVAPTYTMSSEGDIGDSLEALSLEDQNKKLRKLLKDKDNEIIRLCGKLTVEAMNDESQTLLSTPASVMNVDEHQSRKHSKELPTEPNKASSAFTTSSEPPYVTNLRQRLERAQRRAQSFEKDYQLMVEKNAELKIRLNSLESTNVTTSIDDFEQISDDKCAELDKVHSSVADLQRENKTLQKRVRELEMTAAKFEKFKQHSKLQSHHLLQLQDEAKARDSESHQLQMSMSHLEDYVAEIEESRSQMAKDRGTFKEQKSRLEAKVQVVEAEKMKSVIEKERSQNTIKSLSEHLKKLTVENTSLQDRIRKLGFLQNEGRQLSTKVAELQEKLKVVTQEKEEIHSTLEMTQAQATIYEEDFKTEREDRVRAFTERNEEGERYRAEIERLQTQLTSHKGNLSGLEQIHLARGKELMQAMNDLKICQEDLQAKASQVKQYKKQHDGLTTKVTSLQHEKRQLTESFELVRQQLELKSKSAPVSHHEVELNRVRTELEKKVDTYRRKSKQRKAQVAKLNQDYQSAKQELQRVKREVDKLKREWKKSTGSEVSISSPVSDSEFTTSVKELSEQNQKLDCENQELREDIATLKDTIKTLNSLLCAPSDDDDEERAMTEQEILSSPEEQNPKDTAITSTKSRAETDTTRPRSKSMHTSTKHGRSLPTQQPSHNRDVRTSEHHAKSSLPQFQPYQNLPQQSVSDAEKEADIQHADYVNRSRIQAMLAQSKRNQPHSAPTVLDENSLLLPIADFNRDREMNHPEPHHHEGQREFGVGGGSGYSGGGGERKVGGRRGSDPPRNTNGLTEAQRQHELQHEKHYNQSGPTSLPSRPSPLIEHQHHHHYQPPGGFKQPANHHHQPAQHDMKQQQQQRLGDDILTPGINTEVHNVAQDMLDEDGGEGEVTGIPYDPNLTCVVCQKVFRIGEIQLYRTHTETCGGTIV